MPLLPRQNTADRPRRVEKRLGRGGLHAGNWVEECVQRGGLAPCQLQHLGRLRLDTKIERKLPRPRCDKLSQHRTKAHPLGQHLVGLSHDRQILKRVRGVFPSRLRTDETPLLHVAQMVFADAWIPSEKLAPECRSRTDGHLALTIIHWRGRRRAGWHNPR